MCLFFVSTETLSDRPCLIYASEINWITHLQPTFQINKIICFLWMEHFDEFTHFNINYYFHKWAAKYFCRLQPESNQYYINDFMIIWFFFCNQIEKIISNCLNLRTKSIHSVEWIFVEETEFLYELKWNEMKYKYKRFWSWVNWITMLLEIDCIYIFFL